MAGNKLAPKWREDRMSVFLTPATDRHNYFPTVRAASESCVGIRKSAPKSSSTAAPITRLFRSEKNTAEVDYGQAAKRTKARGSLDERAAMNNSAAVASGGSSSQSSRITYTA